jgi:hypothetical protein
VNQLLGLRVNEAFKPCVFLAGCGTGGHPAPSQLVRLPNCLAALALNSFADLGWDGMGAALPNEKNSLTINVPVREFHARPHPL